MALFAGDIKLNDTLRKPIGQINAGAQDKLTAALGMMSARQKASSRASGRVQGEYAPAELARAGDMASAGINDKLLGALGDASLDEYTKVQQHQRNLALASEIGRLSKPSTLEQVLSGLSGAAKSGSQFASLYNQVGKRPQANRPLPTYAMGGYGNDDEELF